MISAFGVDHGGEVSKGFGMPGKMFGVRMGGFGTMKTAGTKAYNRGKKQGLGRVSSGLRAAGSAIKSSPGTAALTGAGTLGVGAAGYKAFDRD
jgi:hypothetical protein